VGGDCDLASCESGDAVIRVRDNVPWEERIRIRGNENSHKTQFSESLYTHDWTERGYIADHQMLPKCAPSQSQRL
jgi:hypothetical protein